MYNWIILLYIRKHNIVNQLYFKKKKIFLKSLKSSWTVVSDFLILYTSPTPRNEVRALIRRIVNS